MLLSRYQLKSKPFIVIMLCLTMIKFLKQLRVFVNLGMLVLLIFQCIRETIPFIMYLVIWIVFFVTLNKYLGANLGTEIVGVGVNFSNYINMFRSSVGDIQEPASDVTKNLRIIWFVFVMSIYFNTIILNNFLIAKVSSVYENF